MKLLSVLVAVLLASVTSHAQRETVFYDFAKNSFGDFADVPSEENLLITGALPPGTEVVEVSVFDEADDDVDDDIYTGQWMSTGVTGQRDFAVPINYRLRPGDDYTFVLRFFNGVTDESRTELYRQVRSSVEAYLNLNYEVDGGELELSRSPRKLRREMDAIVMQSMSRYRITSPDPFDGFSDIVLQQLEQLDGASIEGSDVSKDSQIRALMNLLDGELRSMLNQEIVMLKYERTVADVEAEDKPGYFSIVGGYGAAYFDGDFDDLEYGDGAFVGLGFPFSATKVAPKILRNAELSVGVFVNDFDVEGRTWTGPIVNRPFFVGLDYKLFSFVRFNAGAVILEPDDENQSTIDDLDNDIRIRPFVGLSAKLNLTLTLDK